MSKDPAASSEKPKIPREHLAEPGEAPHEPGAHRPGIDETTRRRERSRYLRELNRTRKLANK